MLTKYSNIWYEYVVKWIPLWIAPNVLTLTSLIIQLIAFYVYLYFEPEMSGTYESFIFYIYLSISLFTYQTLDAIDGKHARNTKNSSPLGQLFDHGCDAIIITILFATVAGTLGTGSNWYGLYVLLMGQITFYAMNLKDCHLGTMNFFGKFGDEEAELSCSFIFAITSITGPQYWYNTKLFFGILNIRDCMGIILFLVAVSNSIDAFYQINKHYKTRFHKAIFYQFGNVFLFQLSICCWNLCGILSKYPVMFITSIAFIFAHLVHKLIICDITKGKPARIQYVIIPYIIIGIVSLFEYVNNNEPTLFNVSMGDYKIIFSVLVYSTFIMIFYAMRCLIDICNLLDIYMFSINPPKIQ